MKTIEQIAKAKKRTPRTVRNWIAIYETENGRLGNWQGNARVFSDEEIALFAPAATEPVEAEPAYEVINPEPVSSVNIAYQPPRAPAPALVKVENLNVNVTVVQKDVDALDRESDTLKGITATAFDALKGLMTDELVGDIRLARSQNRQAVAAAQATAATQAVGAIAS